MRNTAWFELFILFYFFIVFLKIGLRFLAFGFLKIGLRYLGLDFLKSDLDFLLLDFLKSDLDFAWFLKSDLDFFENFFASTVGISRLEKIMPKMEINNIPNMKLNLVISAILLLLNVYTFF